MRRIQNKIFAWIFEFTLRIIIRGHHQRPRIMFPKVDSKIRANNLYFAFCTLNHAYTVDYRCSTTGACDDDSSCCSNLLWQANNTHSFATKHPVDIWILIFTTLINVNIDVVYTHIQMKCEQKMKIILDTPFGPIA